MNQQLNEAKQLFQQGNFDAVVTLCRQYTDQHPMFELLLASALGKRGEYQEAHVWFEGLKRRFANNPDVTFNQALTFKEAGEAASAIALFNSTLQMQQDYHPAWFALGNTFAAQGDIAKAVSQFEQALLRQPQHTPYRLALGQALLQLGEAGKAVQLFYPFNVRNDEIAVTELGLVAYYKCEDRQQATELFEQAFDLGKKSFTLYYYAALIDIDEKRYYRAKRYLHEAQSFETPTSDAFAIELNLAFCEFMLTGDITVLSHFDEKIKTALPKEQLFLAQLYESLGRYKQCENVLEQAEPEDSDEQKKYALLRAKCLLANGEPDVALSVLGNREASEAPSNDYLRVAIAEQTNDFAQAADVLNHIARNQPQPNPFVTQFSDDVASTINRQKTADIADASDAQSPRMVFIVGFPRSGTTLMEQKLADYQGAVVLEETTLIQSLYRRLTEQAQDENVIAWFDRQSDAVKTSIRDDFYARVEHYFGPIKADDWLLDKMPFNCLYVPLITRLFPQAKVIWAHRHPKDIFVSCLKQEEIRIYSDKDFIDAFSQYLTVWDAYKHLPDTQLLNISYEAFVADTDAWMKQIEDWTGLSGSVGHGKKERMVITPSYHQVSQTVYQSSVNKFEHYLGELNGLNDDAFTGFAAALGYTD